LLRVYRHVLICGGTGLYLRAITSGLDDLPATDNEIRKSVQIEFEAQGISFLQEFIKENDPVYFNEVDLNNIRRLTRAVEVIRQTGKPFSYFRKGFQAPGKDAIVTEINLTLDRTSLYARIDQRVDQMMQQGLLDEARKLILFRECQALKTVGYNELFEYLDGKCSLDEAVNKIKQHTRNYAKRQITWFRKFNTGEVLYPDELEKAKSFVL
ncbi:MAG TPA: tRNA (adenosine(37)-N6)-dimethylallyltransferase MiaA, partial [Saprospiraceae bacterium]|nr:tRNA (adenosine(37)-N6)-dimethylallyltransferase MiaA [Saprospiraceae bacterium]